jgi:hypothetical protein
MAVENIQPTKPRTWYQIWLDIWQHPGPVPFNSLLNEPDHRASRGFIWVAVASLITALFTGFTSASSLKDVAPDFYGGVFYLLCLVIATPIFGVLGLIISTGIYHGIARLFGGQGTWTDLVICSSAVAAPAELIAGVISLITLLFVQIPVVMFLPWLISLAIGIYTIILYINALIAAERITTGRAVLIYFIPTIIVGLLALCIVVALIPAFRTTG